MLYKLPTYRVKLVRERERSYPVRQVSSSDDVTDICLHELRDADREIIFAIYINNQGVPVGLEHVARGGANGAAITPRDILKGALLSNACAIIICHNHPSGDPTPSREDNAMTATVFAALAVIGLQLLDHVIVAPTTGRTYSYRVAGAMPRLSGES